MCILIFSSRSNILLDEESVFNQVIALSLKKQPYIGPVVSLSRQHATQQLQFTSAFLGSQSAARVDILILLLQRNSRLPVILFPPRWRRADFDHRLI